MAKAAASWREIKHPPRARCETPIMTPSTRGKRPFHVAPVGSPCQQPPRHLFEGKWYCWRHHPVRLAETEAWRTQRLLESVEAMGFTVTQKCESVTAALDNLREFVGALISDTLWGVGPFFDFTTEDIWHHAVRCGLIVPDPHPQPCPIEGCDCGEYDGKMWRLAWTPATGKQQEEVGDG